MSVRTGGVVLLACLGVAAGCTVSASVAPLSPPAGCSADSSVPCAVGVGWSCAAGDNPENEQSNLSCSLPTANGPDDDFCCFQWTYGSTCTPDNGLTTVCQPGSYGYRCQANDNPASLDSSLNCSSPTPDGAYDDFCCT